MTTDGSTVVVPDPPFDYEAGVVFDAAGGPGALRTPNDVGYTTDYDVAAWIKPTDTWITPSGSNKGIIQLGNNATGVSHIIGYSNTGEMLVMEWSSGGLVINNTDIMLVEANSYLLRARYTGGQIELSLNGNVVYEQAIAALSDAPLRLGGVFHHGSGAWLSGFNPSVEIGHLAIGTNLTIDATKPNVPPTSTNPQGADLIYSFANSVVEDVAGVQNMTVDGAGYVISYETWAVDDVQPYYRIINAGDSFVEGLAGNITGIREEIYDATDGGTYNFVFDGILSDANNGVGIPDLHEGTGGALIQQIQDYFIGVGWNTPGVVVPGSAGAPSVGSLGHLETLLNRDDYRATIVLWCGYNDAFFAGSIDPALMLAAANRLADFIRRIDEIFKLYPTPVPRIIVPNLTPHFTNATVEANSVEFNTQFASQVPTLIGEGRDVKYIDARAVVTNVSQTIDNWHLGSTGDTPVANLIIAEIVAP